MGYRNVDAAFRLYSQPLADRQPAFRVLVYMALRSQDVDTDDQAARVYFAGHEALAVEGLGFEAYDAAGRQAVKRALSVLRDAEAIMLLSAGHRGRNSQYSLQLDTAEIGGRSPYPYSVDNFAMGVTERTPSQSGKGYGKRPERGTLSDPKGVRSASPLQEDKKNKNSPYPRADEFDGSPVDNFEGEDFKSDPSHDDGGTRSGGTPSGDHDGENHSHRSGEVTQASTEQPQPPVMSTDYAVRMRQQKTASAEVDHSNRSVRGTANNFAGSRKGSASPSPEVSRRSPVAPGHVPAEDRAAIELLTADGTDEAFARDMLARAKADPETKAPAARIRQPKYRAELRAAVIGDRNRTHALAAKKAGPCPHGELGGLVPTRAGKPTCATCRAEQARERESA